LSAAQTIEQPQQRDLAILQQERKFESAKRRYSVDDVDAGTGGGRPDPATLDLASQHIQSRLQPAEEALPAVAVVQVPTAVPQRQDHTQAGDR
jgi:hypothetical protein